MVEELKNKEAVVLVHGIWMKGLELACLYYRLKKQGYRVYLFHYPSLFKTPVQNAERLNQYIQNIPEAVIHFVAHSLGGIVLAQLFNQYDIERVGKVVTMGTPINGSALARHVSRSRIKKLLLGKSGLELLSTEITGWKEPHPPLCVIAGTMKLGAGLLLGPSTLEEENDGTVNLEETRVTSATENHVVHQSHFSMLWSPAVAGIVIRFLKS